VPDFPQGQALAQVTWQDNAARWICARGPRCQGCPWIKVSVIYPVCAHRRNGRMRSGYRAAAAGRVSDFFGLGCASAIAFRCSACSSSQMVIGLAMYQVE
jgi:hypothetical protein